MQLILGVKVCWGIIGKYHIIFTYSIDATTKK